MTKEPGVVSAAPIFHKFMEKVLLKYPKQNFQEPEYATSQKPILNGEIDKTNIHSIYIILIKMILKDRNLQTLETIRNIKMGTRN